jgi:pre-rRNA-processing protein IPI3
MALDDDSNATSSDAQLAEFKELKKQVASLQRIQKVTFTQLSELRTEKEYFLSKEKRRAERAKARAKKALGHTNGHANGDVEMTGGDNSDDSDSDDA